MIPRRRTPRLSPTARVDALSDGVFAIVLTLLVLELLPSRPRSPTDLLEEWPTYLAYLAAFFTVSSIWLNHTLVFSRVARADPVVLVLNLVLMLGTSLVPWPTALLSQALDAEHGGVREDGIAALAVYAVVTLLIGLPWSALDRHLARHPALLKTPGDVGWMRRHARFSDFSILVAAVTFGLAFVSPVVSLVIYLLVVAGYVVARVAEREPAAAGQVAPDGAHEDAAEDRT